MAKKYNLVTAREMILDSIDNSDDDGELPCDEESDSDHTDEAEAEQVDELNEDDESSGPDSDESQDQDESTSRPSKRRAVSKGVRSTQPKLPKFYTSRSGMKWSSHPAEITKTTTANLVRSKPGITKEGGVQDIAEAFSLFLTNDILDIVVRETNRYAERYCAEVNNGQNPPQQPLCWNNIDIDELKAVIGLLLIAGADKSAHVSTRDLWSPTAKPVYKSVMTVVRFESILRFMRFDDRRTRDQRRTTDKLAAFRDIWMMFLDRLPKMYRPNMDMTVDEQLVSFRGRSSFRQYIPSKPGKYGLKIFWNCDAMTSYPLKGEIYLGRQPGTAREQNQGEQLVKRLTQPWWNTGRNVTCDNFFTGTRLAEELLSVNTTIVGTMRRNKVEIPSEMQKSKSREEKSSVFGFNRQLTLVSYVPKKNKAVILLSSMHHDMKISEENDKKPDIILHYNDTKSGVDNLDHLVRLHTCKRATRRWPLTLFMNMLDVGGVAAYIVWVKQMPNWCQGKSNRRMLFLSELGHSLILPLQLRRIENPKSLQRGPKLALQLLGFNIDNSQQQQLRTPMGAQGRCHVCPRNRDRKVRNRCTKCHRYCCAEHCSTTCNKCTDADA